MVDIWSIMVCVSRPLTMEECDRAMLTTNLEALVENTGEPDLQEVLSKLVELRVFSPAMADRYKGTPKDLRGRSRQFYIDIQGRGPAAFGKLVDSLDAIGQWNLVKILRPNDPLNNKTQFISLKNKTIAPKPVLPKTKTYASEINEETEKLRPIKVIKSTSFKNSSHPDLTCYSMKSKNRGIVLMINNIEFKDNIEETRLGAREDENNLRELFKQIGFHEFILHNDLSKKEMETVLTEFADNPMLRHTDCLMVIVASHGHTERLGETNVRCHDGSTITTRKIIDYFNSTNCVRLHNIPKVFIFQICRGDTLDYGYRSQQTNPIPIDPGPNTVRTQVDGRSSNILMRTYTDMLIVHSTVPGFQSHRDIKLGSWYFISMCEIFMDRCHDTHLEDLFKLVDRHLKDIHLKRGTLQTSSIDNWGFNKYCYLNPGLFQ